MGDYTGFVCKVKVKKEYYDLIEFIMEGNTTWKEAHDKFKYEWIKEYYVDNFRADFIPYGGYSYNRNWLNFYIEQYKTYFKDGIWFFGIDLKNYENTIEKFIKYVLKNIVEEVYFIKTKFEKDDFEEEHFIKKPKFNFTLEDHILHN